MDFFNMLTLFGGLAMFLYGMRLMGDSLKAGSSGALKAAIEQVTNNPVRAFLLGLLITAVIQSSTATIVITSGLVGAGILTLHQSLGIIIGANVGTTVTGQIIRLLDLNAGGGTSLLRLFQPSSLAPIALILGIILIMGANFQNAKTIGNIAIGFGILFSGLLNMTGAVNTLAESGLIEGLFRGLGANPVIGYLTGAGVAFMLQSSSATIGILQAFSSSGMLTWKAIYAVIVGVYLGDCVTTFIVCAIGAEPDAKRVGIVNILFNLGKSVSVLAVVTIVHRIGLLNSLWDTTVNSGLIANTNTIFNLACAVVLFPLIPIFEKLARIIVKDAPASEDPYRDKLEALNPVFFNTPALALSSCFDMLQTIFGLARTNMERAIPLLKQFDDKVFAEIKRTEADINRLTDHLSQYMVELLPNLRQPYHVSILDQYYKVIGEFEHLGDYAENIADNAYTLAQNETAYSDAAWAEIYVLEDILDKALDKAELAFGKRDLEAANDIEPLYQVAKDAVTKMKGSHLKRMGSGECNIYADASYTNLLGEMKDIASVCSNVGVATLVRVHPELANQEHFYFSDLHAGKDKEYNEEYKKVRERYLARLDEIESQEEKAGGKEA